MPNVFLKEGKNRPGAAIFLSGSGTNVEKLLSHVLSSPDPAYTPKVLVTDRPKSSRAGEIAGKFSLPLVEHGILDFYRAHGEEKVSLATEKGRMIRDLWTDALREKLSPYEIDFGLLAGFVPMSNIVGDFPCLNVHPGDLTITNEKGERIFVGLHTVPVENALLSGIGYLRSSVIVVKPYSDPGSSVDSGFLLGISGKVPYDLEGHKLEELEEISSKRQHPHVHGANKDLLSELARKNQDLLKEKGDWIIYAPIADDFASGLFAYEGDLLYYRKDKNSPYRKIRTIEYTSKGKEIWYDDDDGK